MVLSSAPPLVDMRLRAISWSIACFTGLMMVTTVVVLVHRKSRSFDGEFVLALFVAILPSAIFAFTRSEQRRVLLYGTAHVTLLMGLVYLYLVGAGPYGFIIAFIIYIAALATSIVAAVGS